MQTFRITIEPVSPGTQKSSTQNAINPGSGDYLINPMNQVEVIAPITQAQIVGIQGYLSLILAGTNTGAIETAITGVGPT